MSFRLYIHVLMTAFLSDWGSWHWDPEEWGATPDGGRGAALLQSPTRGTLLWWSGTVHDQRKLPCPGPHQGKDWRQHHQRVPRFDWSNWSGGGQGG